MTELLHATGVRLGLVTNGEHWMLVDAPKGETTGYASWYASLWLEEKITLRAFRSLLSQTRFFGVADDQTIEALLAESASNQQEVTDRLGLQVRRAVEVLIHSLDKADQDFDRALLADVPESVLYESALTVMMRLVFLFCAEERELIPSKPFPVYERNYSVSAIINQLEDLAQQHGEELLERRNDAWSRLLTAFRVVYGGLQHEDVYIPAYGGKLFDPDRFPFLEGRKSGTTWREHEAKPLPVNNRTVLHLLKSLQYLEMRASNSGGAIERRRLSFRALDIEQIGHVYEGLLDHTAKRATEPILGLVGAKNKEPEISLAELQKKCDHETHEIHEKKAFVEYLKDRTGKSESALKKALQIELDDQQTSRFRTACQTDELWEQVNPFAGLIRNDTFGYPVVILTGSAYVTSGTDRRSSGTHYTPKSLTEPIVQDTLEPLVYVGPAEGKPKNEWQLKSAAELLQLKICDMACGSGAFLVQACRYMAARVLEAWEMETTKHTNDTKEIPDKPIVIDPKTGQLVFPDSAADPLSCVSSISWSILPSEASERLTFAMRIIAQRCLYGVDINPLAAEMAKLSLWLLTLAKDKPFEFLDHTIRCGDSLVGISSLEQLQTFSLDPAGPQSVRYRGIIKVEVEEAVQERLRIGEMLVHSIDDVRKQEELLRQSEARLQPLRDATDLLVSASFWQTTVREREEWTRHFSVVANELMDKKDFSALRAMAVKERRGKRMFHWPLEFPEVCVQRGGFDAFVGNPPFMGGTVAKNVFGETYKKFISNVLGQCHGNADIAAWFFRNAGLKLRDAGVFGLLGSDSVGEGDTRDSGLSVLISGGFTIHFARSSFDWPGVAAVKASITVARRGPYFGARILDEQQVDYISSRLDNLSVEHPPPVLIRRGPDFIIGTKVYGEGFVLSDAEFSSLRNDDPNSTKLVQPYQTGSDLNSTPDQSATRWVINFGDMPLAEASRFRLAFARVETLVKPEREASTTGKARSEWWKYERPRSELYSRIGQKKRVLAKAKTSSTFAFAWVDSSRVFADTMFVSPDATHADFAVVSSSIYEQWAMLFCSTLKGDMRFASSDMYDNFPFPNAYSGLGCIGEKYDRSRARLMKASKKGITSTYKHFHTPDDSSADIEKLRDLHVEMDRAVSAAYGWTDFSLDHGFHETKQGIRYTISEPARREVLQRLLKLNHERYAGEVKQGLHGKKGGAGRVVGGGKAKAAAGDSESVVPAAKHRASKKPAKSKSSDAQAVAEERTLFNMDDKGDHEIHETHEKL